MVRQMLPADGAFLALREVAVYEVSQVNFKPNRNMARMPILIRAVIHLALWVLMGLQVTLGIALVEADEWGFLFLFALICLPIDVGIGVWLRQV